MKTTSNQPEHAKTRIYGNHKPVPTIHVRLKDSDDDREMVINEADFDADVHIKVE